MRPELDAVLIYLPALGEAEHLVATAIGEDGLVPASELVKAAAAREKIQVGQTVRGTVDRSVLGTERAVALFEP